MKTNQTSIRRATRSGFTLLELLAVITIISILLALILPAISGVWRSVNETAVATELTQFDQALTTFNTKFGRYPPSSIVLWDSQAEWDANPDHKSIIRSMWKDFDFATGGRTTDATHPWFGRDIQLTGDECIVFFLAGVPIPSVTPGVPPTFRGFSTNGRFPFATAGTNRVGPFYDNFDTNRLVDGTPSDLLPTPGADGIYSYTDGLGDGETPIWYSASENGRYSKADAVYYESDGTTPWNKDTFQIIAPGADGIHGDLSIAQPPGFPPAVWTKDTILSGSRKVEVDNITNFSGGRLGG